MNEDCPCFSCANVFFAPLDSLKNDEARKRKEKENTENWVSRRYFIIPFSHPSGVRNIRNRQRLVKYREIENTKSKQAGAPHMDSARQKCRGER